MPINNSLLMNQQLLESTIQLLPETLDQVLPKLQALLSSHPLSQPTLVPIIKAIFYGVWNFDKMINQHLLNTRLAEMISKLPKKNGLVVFRGVCRELRQKWNMIDHHRINKFMQLQRYLLTAAFRLCDRLKLPRQRVDAILQEEIFTEDDVNGLACHIMDIYVPVWKQIGPIKLEDLTLFEHILTTHNNPTIRRYVIDHVYSPFKQALIEQAPSLSDLEEPLQQCVEKFLILAGEQQDDARRKDLYTLVGFYKSGEVDFDFYYQEKSRKAELEKQKRIRKMSKGKKAEVARVKQKRREKKKEQAKHKPSKIMSKRKFEK